MIGGDGSLTSGKICSFLRKGKGFLVRRLGPSLLKNGNSRENFVIKFKKLGLKALDLIVFRFS